ncbi:hypothetical protein D3C81_1558240 [compost metagenome]
MPGVERLAAQAQFVERAARHQVLQHAQYLRRKYADLDLRQPEHRALAGHRQVAHRHQAHAARHAGAVDARHQRHGGLARAPQQVGQALRGFGIVESEGLAGLQVGAGTEGLLACARDHHGPDRVIALRLFDAGKQAVQHRGADRIAPLRPVDGQPQHGPADFVQQFGVHARSPVAEAVAEAVVGSVGAAAAGSRDAPQAISASICASP